MSLKYKIFLIISVTLITASLIIGAPLYFRTLRNLTTHLGDDLKKEINHITQLAHFYFDQIETTLVSLADNKLVNQALENGDLKALSQVSEFLTSTVDSFALIESIHLMSIDGSRCLILTADEYALPSVLGRDFSERDYCRGIIDTGKPYLSAAYISVSTGLPSLGLAVPVKDIRGRITGFLMGRIALKELRGYIWDTQSDSAAHLHDRNGVLIIDTLESIRTLDTSHAHSRGITDRLAKNINEAYFIDGDEYIGYRNLGSFMVVYQKSLEGLWGFASGILFTIFIGLGSMISVIFVMIFVLGSRILGKIEKLKSFTERIAKGEFDASLEKEDFESDDELSVLARSLSTMAGKLKDFYKNLEIRIKEQTVEVEEKNKKLVEREIELKKSLALEEETNDLLIGRELEMIKLKERIKELESRKK